MPGTECETGDAPIACNRQMQASAREVRDHVLRRLVVQATGNSFGHSFRVTTWGESHGKSVGCLIDGCPARLAISQEEIQAELDRRRPGQSRISTPRQESGAQQRQV